MRVNNSSRINGYSVYPQPVQPICKVTPARPVGQEAQKDLGGIVEISREAWGMRKRVPVDYLPEYSEVVRVINDDSVREI